MTKVMVTVVKRCYYWPRGVLTVISTGVAVVSFVLGLYHGMGSDHLLAITTLVSRSASLRRAWLLGLRFALGHMGILLALGALAIYFNVVIPEGFEKWTEVLGGGLLVLLGAWLLLDLAMGRVGEVHLHPHLHGRDPRHEHSHTAAVLGGLFAVSGLRSLVLMVPIAVAQSSVLLSAAYILVFGAGLVLSMSVYAYLVSRVYGLARGHDAVFKGTTAVTGLAGIALGVLWMVNRLG